MLANHNDDKNFTSFSFKDFDETTADETVKSILKDLKPEDLIVLDLNLSRFKYIFNYLINSNLQNKVINTFGTIENRFEKISFNLIQLIGNHGIPSVSIEDLILLLLLIFISHFLEHMQKVTVLSMNITIYFYGCITYSLITINFNFFYYFCFRIRYQKNCS